MQVQHGLTRRNKLVRDGMDGLQRLVLDLLTFQRTASHWRSIRILVESSLVHTTQSPYDGIEVLVQSANLRLRSRVMQR